MLLLTRRNLVSTPPPRTIFALILTIERGVNSMGSMGAQGELGNWLWKVCVRCEVVIGRVVKGWFVCFCLTLVLIFLLLG